MNKKYNKQRPDSIDRHDCLSMDVNKDSIPDIICVVGAGHATYRGYTELYLTQKDGSLKKVRHHGLHKYPTMATRVVTKLRHKSGAALIFVGTSGKIRKDKKTNAHRMFLHLKTGKAPYFRELKGSFIYAILEEWPLFVSN